MAILTGAGDAFCAGADLKTYIPPIIQQATPRWVRDNVATGLGGLTRGLHRIYKPTIAAVNGWALAGGLELALACDIRVASERAMFGSFEARRGYHHGDGGIVRLVNTCGTGIALEMLLTAEPIDAQRALGCNMVSRVVAHDELLAAAEEVAGKILRNSQVAVRSAKETILDVVGRPLDEQLRLEALNGYSCADGRRRWACCGASTTAPTRVAPANPEQVGDQRGRPRPPSVIAATSLIGFGRQVPAAGARSLCCRTSWAAAAPDSGTRMSRGPAARKSGTSKPAVRRRRLGTPSSSSSPWISSASAWLRPPATRTSSPSA